MSISIANNIISSDPGNGLYEDFLRDKNIKPHPVQEQLLTLPDEIFEALYGGAAYGGKDILKSTLVLTISGYKEIQYIHPGDYVIGRDGYPKLVLAEINGSSKEFYKLTFSNGEIIECGGDHKWNTWTEVDRDKKQDIVRTKRREKRAKLGSRGFSYYRDNNGKIYIKKSTYIEGWRSKSYQGTIRSTQELYETKFTSRDRPNHAIKVSNSIHLDEIKLPVHPYIFGCWLGDGTTNSDVITIGDEDINHFLYEFHKLGFELVKIPSSPISYKIKGFARFTIGKYILDDYFLGSEEQRKNLLQGLMDTDGTCDPDGGVEFCNTNKDLADGVFRLASSLGIKCSLYIKENTFYVDKHGERVFCKVAYLVKWSNDYPVFKLERKLNHLNQEKTLRSSFHYIENIEQIDKIETKCIQVEDDYYLVTKSNIPTHNSWILTLLPLFRGFYKFRGYKGIILRNKFPDLEREIIRLSKEYYPKTGAKYNEQKHSWEWPEYNSYQDFGHVQHAGDITMYDSSQYNYCAFDELTHFSSYPYHYMVGSRVRPSSSFNIAIVRNGSNPGGIGQTFVYKRFVEACEDGYKVIRDKETKLLRIFIPAKAEDNPYGMEYDPLYVKKLEILKVVSEAEYKAKRYGDWHAYKGSVFTTFRPMHFSGEPSNALHVIKRFSIPEWWPRILSIDWGKRAMCYAMWGAISPNHRVYIFRERAWYGRDIPYWASEIREIHNENNETPSHTVLCGSAWQNRGGELIADEFQKYSDIVPSSSENTPGSRVAGLQLVHDFLRWEKKTSLRTKNEFYDMSVAQEIYRNYGPQALENYKKQFYDEPDEENLPILQIFEECKILIDTIPMCIYAEDKPGKPAEDIAEFEGDDPIDDLRYFCKAAKKFIAGEIGSLNMAAKIDQVNKNLQISGDMTSYYRQMEAIEKQDQSTLQDCFPVSRRSRFARRVH